MNEMTLQSDCWDYKYYMKSLRTNGCIYQETPFKMTERKCMHGITGIKPLGLALAHDRASGTPLTS